MSAKGVIVAGSPPPGAESPLDRAVEPHLLPIGNRPILLHAVEGMQRAGIEEVAIVAPREQRAAIEAVLAGAASSGPAIEIIAAPPRDVTASALAVAERFAAGSPFLLQAGDGLLRHDVSDVLAAVSGGDADAIALVGRDPAGAGDCRSIVHLRERPPAVPATWAEGAHVFGPDVVARVRRRLGRDAGDPTLLGLFEALRRDGARVEARLVRWWSRFDGDPRALLRMNRVVLDELVAEPLAVPPGCQIEGRVVIDPTARVESSVLNGPVVIGPGAVVADAYVGPYTALGAGVRVENAEIEHSIAFANAQITHIAGRIEASVIGRGARVFRDFSVPRALRLQVGDGARVALP
jgi:glucose-1-phosphate thymidylyltransferase